MTRAAQLDPSFGRNVDLTHVLKMPNNYEKYIWVCVSFDVQ